MLRSIKRLQNFKIQAKDGEFGRLREFYFDDGKWMIRYLIVDTGKWFPGRLVLISPHAFRQLGWDEKIFSVTLTKKQIENSPEINRHIPVSRLKELELGESYGWPTYWDGFADTMPGAISETTVESSQVKVQQNLYQLPEDSYLRSTHEVIGYKVRAKDDVIGRVKDFIIDDKAWVIRYIEIVLMKWLYWIPGGKKVLVSPPWIEQVNWCDYSVNVNLAKELIEKAPNYNPSDPISRDYEVQLFQYYSKPEYWLKE